MPDIVVWVRIRDTLDPVKCDQLRIAVTHYDLAYDLDAVVYEIVSIKWDFPKVSSNDSHQCGSVADPGLYRSM